MKFFVLLVCFFSILFSCDINCVSCHPNLNLENKEHSILKTCSKCHIKEKLDKINMGQSSCGQDCFRCHSVEKFNFSIAKEHNVTSCIECHQNIDKNTFVKNTNNLIPLKNFLKKE